MDRINFLPPTVDVIAIQQAARSRAYEASLKQDKEELRYLIGCMRRGSFRSLKGANNLAQSIITKQKIIDIKRSLI